MSTRWFRAARKSMSYYITDVNLRGVSDLLTRVSALSKPSKSGADGQCRNSERYRFDSTFCDLDTELDIGSN